jgi:hypothetical protein
MEFSPSMRRPGGFPKTKEEKQEACASAFSFLNLNAHHPVFAQNPFSRSVELRIYFRRTSR